MAARQILSKLTRYAIIHTASQPNLGTFAENQYLSLKYKTPLVL